MNTLNLKNLALVVILCFSGFGCSMIDSLRNPAGQANQAANTAPATDTPVGSITAASTSPCVNKYNPVADGAIRNYKMSGGGKDAKFVQSYTTSASNFTEELTIGTTTVKHKWECTLGGLVAANPGSVMDTANMQIEPKHISGVTLPNESDIQVGKEWKTVYQATGKSPLGDISSDVTLNNKVVATDDEVKVPAGTYKAVKVEVNLDVAMKMGGKSIPVPAIKSYVWFAPGIGMVKNNVGEGTFGNSTMEYLGDK